MLNKIKKKLYTVSRKTASIASSITDVEALISGNPKKIARRVKKKAINKRIYKIANKISKRI